MKPSHCVSREQSAVEAAGGVYVGTEEGYVYFNDPRTGTTLIVSQAQLKASGSEFVRWKLEQSRKNFKGLKSEW